MDQENQQQEENNDELKEVEQEEASQAEQQLLRLQADFENFRKRTLREREEVSAQAGKDIIKDILPVLDNLHRALEAGKQKGDLDKFIEGVDMIYSQLWDVLQEKGLEYIDCKGKEFDPEIHQAVMQKEIAEGEDDIILDEIQRGYLLNGKLIRPAMVSVSKKG
jgi:molecular chaperone GrpE